MPDPTNHFADYERTIIEITLPDGKRVSTSPGNVPPRELSDLLPLVVITAWNPGEERPGLDANRAAHQELLVCLRDGDTGREPLDVLPAVGRAPDDSHAEESVAVHGLKMADAIVIARRMRQVAIFEISAERVSVVDCHADRLRKF